MTVFIYTLADPRTGEIRYVGKTIDWRGRFYGHCQDTERTHKAAWIRSLKTIGLLPVMEELEVIVCDDESIWQEAERFWISTLRFYGCPLTNLEDGGRGGCRVAAETKLKISESLKGRPKAPFTDTHKANIRAARKLQICTPETRAKIGASSRGRKASPETLAKRSAALKGRIIKPEWRVKISNTLKGRKASPEKRVKLSAHLKERWASPDYKEKMKLAQQNSWASTARRKRCAAASRRAWEKRRAAKQLTLPL